MGSKKDKVIFNKLTQKAIIFQILNVGFIAKKYVRNILKCNFIRATLFSLFISSV